MPLVRHKIKRYGWVANTPDQRDHSHVEEISTHRSASLLLLVSVLLVGSCSNQNDQSASGKAKALASKADALKVEMDALAACAERLKDPPRAIADTREQRFQGKVQKDTARCRGGERAENQRNTPWVDWPNYWGTRDASSLARFAGANPLGINGALVDLEYQRVELLKFNLFDNNQTYREYVEGRAGTDGRALKTWKEMLLPQTYSDFDAVGGNSTQECRNDLIRFRTVTGICNDIFNPLMGSTNTPFARNVEFDATFPDLGASELARNRHGDRLSLLKPDPQVISRKLFTRAQSSPEKCADGYGLPGAAKEAACDYKKAPFFNVLAAFWIQFMTHDWFSHLEEGHNQAGYMKVGCESQKVNGAEATLTPEQVNQLGCRPGDAMDKALIAKSDAPPTFEHDGNTYLARAPRTFRNTNTAWWDASQLYGYDERSRKRVKRDPKDPAKLLLVAVGDRPGAGEKQGYLPLFQPGDPINPAWRGQEATGFPDNWTIGMSFYHNVFAREHNAFVDAFRRQAAASPNDDSGLRNPLRPDRVIAYKDVTANELFEVGRLVVSAVIAKIHTIEWTPQLLYDEPLYKGMNSNWHGLISRHEEVADALAQVVTGLGKAQDPRKSNEWYSVLASGPGIFGLGSHRYDGAGPFAAFDPNKKDVWSIANPDHVNGGVNHFGSPFNFPEEFVTVYRLHPLVPDLIEYRDWQDPNPIRSKIPVVETFRSKATDAMRSGGLASFALSMGRQRLGALALQNHPRFLQNLKMTRLTSATQQIDVAALDIIRDRERGVPRFNEFRRQYGLSQLASFDDFIDRRPGVSTEDRKDQEQLVKTLREVYGQHTCDAAKIITKAQVNRKDGSRINDCLGHPNGTVVDNIEDLDTVVGWLAESTRPHGFAISETQFVVFILNASRRLYSDRFFTSSFRPEFYTTLGYQWVKNSGPGPEQFEEGKPNGHQQPVSPLKRVLLRVMPELEPELRNVVNVFDPWARNRGEYYGLQWQPRKGAESDEAFTEK